MAFSLMGQIGSPAAGGFFDDYDGSDDDGGDGAGAATTMATSEKASTDTTQMDMMSNMNETNKYNVQSKSTTSPDSGESGKPKNWWEEDDDPTELQNSDEIVETEDPDLHMADFDEIKEMIAKIENNETQVYDLSADISSTTQSSEETRILRKLNEILADNRKNTMDVKKKLEQLQAANDKYEKENPSSSIAQMRHNTLNSCTRRFKDASTAFQGTLNEFHSELKSKQRRQISNYDSRLDDDQIDEMVDDPAKASDFIQKTVQMQDISDEMLNRITELEERHDGMLKIQRGMHELNEMWKELAVLITDQQELLDNISYNVEMTAEYVEKGVVQLQKAEEHQKKSRKCKLYLLACGLAALIVLLLSVLGGTGQLGGS